MCSRWGGTLQACTTTKTGAEQSEEPERPAGEQGADGSRAIVADDFRHREERNSGRQSASKFRAEPRAGIQDATALRGWSEFKSDSTGSQSTDS